MRSRFDVQLEQLNSELITLGSLCTEAISHATKALLEGDIAEVNIVKDADRQIDQKERDIENLCFRLLLQQQPVARDLRTISAALKMISDMERIGDQAADIAEIVTYGATASVVNLIDIRDMGSATIEMVKLSVDSFIKKDRELAREVMFRDDVVDELFGRVKEEITTLIRNSDISSDAALDLLMIAKYFERIGDHAVNIAEWVEYSVTGVHIEDKELKEQAMSHEE